MHNRARLLVGSFLTKDLGIDWRWGERWFMRLLLDGDEASNNGNWQWIASVGVDPQPAFRRIFNPAPPAGALRPRRRVRAPLRPRAGRRARRLPRRAVDDARPRSRSGRAAGSAATTPRRSSITPRHGGRHWTDIGCKQRRRVTAQALFRASRGEVRLGHGYRESHRHTHLSHRTSPRHHDAHREGDEPGQGPGSHPRHHPARRRPVPALQGADLPAVLQLPQRERHQGRRLPLRTLRRQRLDGDAHRRRRRPAALRGGPAPAGQDDEPHRRDRPRRGRGDRARQRQRARHGRRQRLDEAWLGRLRRRSSCSTRWCRAAGAPSSSPTRPSRTTRRSPTTVARWPRPTRTRPPSHRDARRWSRPRPTATTRARRGADGRPQRRPRPRRGADRRPTTRTSRSPPPCAAATRPRRSTATDAAGPPHPKRWVEWRNRADGAKDRGRSGRLYRAMTHSGSPPTPSPKPRSPRPAADRAERCALPWPCSSSAWSSRRSARSCGRAPIRPTIARTSTPRPRTSPRRWASCCSATPTSWPRCARS